MPQRRQDPEHTRRLEAELKAQEKRDRELAERLKTAKAGKGKRGKDGKG